MITLAIAALVMILGLVLYFAVKTNEELKEIARISFFVGLFWVVYFIGHTPALRL